jgi:hypothetical protein
VDQTFQHYIIAAHQTIGQGSISLEETADLLQRHQPHRCPMYVGYERDIYERGFIVKI